MFAETSSFDDAKLDCQAHGGRLIEDCHYRQTHTTRRAKSLIISATKQFYPPSIDSLGYQSLGSALPVYQVRVRLLARTSLPILFLLGQMNIHFTEFLLEKLRSVLQSYDWFPRYQFRLPCLIAGVTMG